jgi:hypothetical protein
VNWNATANHVIVITLLVIAKMDLLSLIVQVCNNNYLPYFIIYLVSALEKFPPLNLKFQHIYGTVTFGLPNSKKKKSTETV